MENVDIAVRFNRILKNVQADWSRKVNRMIKVQNLTKKFNGKIILNGISFHVQKGEIFGFLGPNGAGKTTTFRIILGLINPTSGEALVFGEYLGSNDELRKRVGILLENDGLYEQMSAYENLDYYAQLYNVPDRAQKIKRLLDFVRLSDRKDDKVGK
jgi:ABC-2 type transport system ATP-binding protein